MFPIAILPATVIVFAMGEWTHSGFCNNSTLFKQKPLQYRKVCIDYPLRIQHGAVIRAMFF